MLRKLLFEVNEILTMASGIVAAASWLWMKIKVPEYRLAHLRSPGPFLGIVQAYRDSERPKLEKTWVSNLFQAALTIFLVCAVISFIAGFKAAVRGPAS